MGDGGFPDPVAHRDPQPVWLGQRAVRSHMGAAASAAGGVDGAGRPGNKLHAHVDRGDGPARRLDLPLASRGLQRPRGLSGERTGRFLLSESAARNV